VIPGINLNNLLRLLYTPGPSEGIFRSRKGNVNRPSFLQDLKRIFPADRILKDTAQLSPYESDALTAYQSQPLAVVIPETQEEVIQAVQICHAHQVPFVARGSGTSLSGGSLPVKDGLVIALNRLNHILKIVPTDRIVIVEPGVVNLDVSKAVAEYGLYYAPDPSSQLISTIGGNLAFNAGGAHCLKNGVTSNHVLSIKALLPDGEVVILGGESQEGVGPDLAGLFVGSEGLFGIALEITLRLMPRPEVFRTLLASYDSLEKAGHAVGQIVASGILAGAIEMMDRLAIQAAEAAVHPNYPQDAAALLIVELEGETCQVEGEFQLLMEILQQSGAGEIRVAANETERAMIWKGRKSAFSAVGRLSPDYIVQDGVVPRGKLGEALAQIEKLSAEYGIRVANVFHAGDGNLHPLILYDGRNAGQLEKAKELAAQIMNLCIDLGGSITGEHGIGMEKRSYLGKMFNDVDVGVMRRLHQAIDPQQLANKGKMFLDLNYPPGQAPEYSLAGLHPLEKAGIISRE
jgi:glycolate oxidase